MKKVLGLLLALAAAPASAEGAASSFTPDQDLSCAVWASFIVGSYEEADVQNAYIPMMYFFVGRYESATGKDFRDAFTARTLEFDADFSKLEALDDICEPVKADIAARFTEWSERMDAETAAGE